MNVTQIHKFWAICDDAGVVETRVQMYYPRSGFPIDDTDSREYWRLLDIACKWCDANVEKPWSRLNAEFKFFDPGDAMVFRLRFG